MASLANPFDRRAVQIRKGSAKVSLSGPDLETHGISRGDELPCRYDRHAGTLEIALEDPDFEPTWLLDVVAVGGSDGVTIPAPVRHEHDLSADDALWFEPRDGEATGWTITLEERAEVEQRAHA